MSKSGTKKGAPKKKKASAARAGSANSVVKGGSKSKAGAIVS